ncbi:MAG: cytochrome b/b6 domain-containing protein [Actinomycetota bacterium]
MAETVAIERHRRGNRWTHWINGPVLLVMIWSGLRIYWADLRDPFGVGIGAWHWFDLFPTWFNETFDLERRLARGLAFHLTFGWIFVLNGLAFGVYLIRTGGWRNFVPTAADLRTIPAVLAHDLGLRKEAPPQGKYNGVQQLSYAAVIVMGFLAALSGFAIYKPTQLSFLTAAFGGYEAARFVHFWVTIGFVLFIVVHLLQVFRAGAANLWTMVTGYELLTVEADATDEIEKTDQTDDAHEKVTT